MHTFAQPVLAGEPHSQARSLFISSLESMNSGRQEKLKEQLFSSRNSPLILSCLSGHGWRRRVRQWSERRHKSLPLDTNRTTSFSHRRRRSPPLPPPRSSLRIHPPHTYSLQHTPSYRISPPKLSAGVRQRAERSLDNRVSSTVVAARPGVEVCFLSATASGNRT